MSRLSHISCCGRLWRLRLRLVAAQERVAFRAGRLVDVDRGEVRRDQVV